MKKQKIQLLVIGCILILCVAGYLFAKNTKTSDEAAEEQESVKVTSITEADVTEMEYINNGATVDLIKENDTWYNKADKSMELSQSDVKGMVSYICNVSSDTVIDAPEALETYGLKNPVNTISVTLKDGSVVQLLIGDYLDMTGQYYAMVPGDSNVYMIQSYVASSFEKSAEELLEVQETTEQETTTEESTTEEITTEEGMTIAEETTTAEEPTTTPSAK